VNFVFQLNSGYLFALDFLQVPWGLFLGSHVQNYRQPVYISFNGHGLLLHTAFKPRVCNHLLEAQKFYDFPLVKLTKKFAKQAQLTQLYSHK